MTLLHILRFIRPNIILYSLTNGLGIRQLQTYKITSTSLDSSASHLRFSVFLSGSCSLMTKMVRSFPVSAISLMLPPDTRGNAGYRSLFTHCSTELIVASPRGAETWLVFVILNTDFVFLCNILTQIFNKHILCIVNRA